MFGLESRLKSKYLIFSPRQQVRLKVPVEHELHDGVDGLVPRAHAEQLNDVLVVEALHHVGLAEEVDLLVHGRAGLERLHGNGDLGEKEGRQIVSMSSEFCHLES